MKVGGEQQPYRPSDFHIIMDAVCCLTSGLRLLGKKGHLEMSDVQLIAKIWVKSLTVFCKPI